jgi:hypothetical protein
MLSPRSEFIVQFYEADGDTAPRLIDEAVPRPTAVGDDVVVGFEDVVREPVVAHELPDVLLRVEFRAFRGRRPEGDVGRDVQRGMTSAAPLPAFGQIAPKI